MYGRLPALRQPRLALRGIVNVVGQNTGLDQLYMVFDSITVIRSRRQLVQHVQPLAGATSRPAASCTRLPSGSFTWKRFRSV